MTRTKITCIVGDLTKQPDCDAIVNSANPSMRAGSGVCGAIHRAAGRDLEKCGMILGPLNLGQAVITPGFNLLNRFVIHLSAPKYHLDPDPPVNLALAINNALKLAEANGVKRIALPAIATGIYGYPIEEAVKVFVQTAQLFLESEVLEEIRFVFFTVKDAEVMQECIDAISATLGLSSIDIEVTESLNASQLQNNIMPLANRFRGALLGLACGDAVGTTVEFRQRGTFPLVTDMIGGGPFKLKAGEWTDDTSMALCLAESLLECNSFDAKDQMNRYVKWLNEGYWSSNGRCFDIGGTTHDALSKFTQSGNPFSGSTHAESAGNGCIMRLAPVPMYFYPDRDAAINMSGDSSRTTHGADECVEASRLFGAMLFMALDGAGKDAILLKHGMNGFLSAGIQSIAIGEYRIKPESEIHGTGYVVRSLEAALWCFYHTSSFQEAILKATNLGQDADTTAAICGQIAGAFYGEIGIPEGWLLKLARHEDICLLADQLSQKGV